MNKYFVFIILLLVISLGATAQVEETDAPGVNRIGLQIGVQNTLLKDLNYSPLNYSGIGIGVSFQYSRLIAKKHTFKSDLSYSFQKIQASELDYTASLHHFGSLDFTYLHLLKQTDNSLELYLGGSLATVLDVTDFEELEAVTYFNFHGLSLATQVGYTLSNNHKFTTILKLALLGIVARPPYTGWDSNGFEKGYIDLAYKGDFVLLNKITGINWTNIYSFTYSDKWDLKLQVSLQYFKTELTESSINMHTQVSLGAHYKY